LLADKLSETKKAEREAKEAHKAALQASKQKNQEVSNKRLYTVWSLRHYFNGFCNQAPAVMCQSHSRCPKAVAYLQGKAAERAAFKEVRSVSNSTSKRAATDARQVYCAQNTQID